MIRIREVGEDDVDLILPLFLDMEWHYEGAGAIDQQIGRERLRRALRDNPPGILLAAFGRKALGFAALYEMFPGLALQSTWYLKELYVAEAARGRLVGEALLRAAARAVLARGGTRIEFTTGEDNDGARRFYRRLGAPEMPKVFYRYETATLTELAEGSEEPEPS